MLRSPVWRVRPYLLINLVFSRLSRTCKQLEERVHYPESKATDGEDLVRRAKKTGKNRVELFWSDDSGPAQPVGQQARR